jgi:phage-related tail protein
MQATARARERAQQAADRESQRIQREEQRRLEDAAREQARIEAAQRRETDQRHEEFREQIEEKFQLLNGYTVAFEDLTTRQIARLNQLSTEETRFLGNMRGHTEDLAAGTIAALAGAAGAQTSALDAVKESVGQMLIAKGTEAIYSGTIKSVQLNPLGPLEIAAGVTAIAAGSSMSGKGAGAAAGAGASPSVPSTTPGESMTQYTNVSFGFVGDRRQIGRDVADAQEDARRRGL